MLKLTHINKDFGNGHGLHDVSVDFPANKTTVIVGPSGSGKTTLLRTIDFLELPDAGQYDFDDLHYDLSQPLTKQEVLAARKKLGIVFQGYNLFPHLSVLANITEGPIHVLKQSKQDAEKNAHYLLDKVGLGDKANVYPDQLSGGQQQRIAIVRMVAMNPEYMLFDEPTSALDPELEVEVLKVILELAKMEDSIVIVTHNMDFARGVADKIVFVEDGKIEYQGDPKTFFEQPTPRIQAFLAAGTFDPKEV